MRVFKGTAQSLIEYVTLISIVTMAFTIMFPMVKRVVQSVVKTGADQIGEQNKATHASFQTNTTTNVFVDSRRTRTQTPNRIRQDDVDTTTTRTVTSTKM